MSIHIIGEVWDYSRSSGTARLVLLALADYADRESRLAWPSKREVAKRTRVSERSVQRALRELERLEEIELIEAGGPPNRSARYRITLQAPQRRQSDPTQRPGGDTAGAERGQRGSRVGTPVSPEPPGDPSAGSSSAREPTTEEDLPSDFPDRLLPVLDKQVLPVLQRVAKAKTSSVAPTRGAVARAIATFPDRDHIDAATDIEQWLVNGTGRKTPVADVVQSFRRALARSRAQEPLDDRPEPDRGGRTQRQRNLSRYDRVMQR